MEFSWGIDPEKLASGLDSFIRDPRTTGGSYKTTVGKNFVRCQLGKYTLDYEFLNKVECDVKVTNGSSIEKTLEVSYIHATEPDFLKLFTETCTLAQKLSNKN